MARRGTGQNMLSVISRVCICNRNVVQGGNVWRQIAQWMQGLPNTKDPKPKKDIFSTRLAAGKYSNETGQSINARTKALNWSTSNETKKKVSEQQAGVL